MVSTPGDVPRQRVHMRRAVAVAILLALASVVLLAPRAVRRAVRPLSKGDLITMTLEGDEIVRAGRRFVADRGRAPASFEDLVPTFLATMPVPAKGWGPWELHPRSPGSSDVREFAVSRSIDGSVGQWASAFTRITCYVRPERPAHWHGRELDFVLSENRFLRTAAP